MNSDHNATAREKFTAVSGIAVRTMRNFESRLALALQLRSLRKQQFARRKPMRYALLWLLGIPIPVLLLLWFFHVL